MKQYAKTIKFLSVFLVIYFISLITIKAGAIDSPEHRIPGIEEVGYTFDEFVIPTDVQVVGIGEATHGNREFQQVKLWVLQKMVDNGTCHSIAFEMSPGEAAGYNDAIHQADGDLAELLGGTNYPIYDTEEMTQMLEWMREYNLTHSAEESLVFYGVDMQGEEKELAYLDAFCHEYPELFTEEELMQIAELGEEVADPQVNFDATPYRDFLAGLQQKLLTVGEGNEARAGYGDQRFRIAAEIAGTIVQWIDAPSFEEDPNGYGQYRDDCMAANLKYYYETEADRGYPQILITAHNGHSMKGNAQGYGDYTMGNKINELFAGSYYSIGTEFYNSCVNIHTAGTYDEEYVRADHFYCSSDPLAYQAQFFEGGIYCLDFAQITDTDSMIFRLLHTPGFTGCAGEGYNAYTDFYRSYRSKMVIADHYDAMIYFYETTPIRAMHY